MIKKAVTVLLILATLLTFAGCEKQSKTKTQKLKADNSKTKRDTETVSLLFNKSDSLNPYAAKTENNRNIGKLIFEPLIKTDNNIKPVYRLAKEVKKDGKRYTVTLIDTSFSDGSPLTASDVAYSYNLAKKYNGLYTKHLYEVSSVTVISPDKIAFNLDRYDPYFENLLDFPILKSGSEKNTDSDGNIKPPVGCGRYKATDNKYLLVQNDKYFGQKGSIKTIKLINAPDNDSISHYIEIGATELYYSDLSSGNIARMSGKRTDINLNNLIYIGINFSVEELKSPYLRYAISSAVDRSALCKDAYFNTATVATGFFNPSLSETKSVQTLKSTADLEITVENLSKIGYNKKNGDGYYVDGNGKHRIFKMIVNKENNSRVTAAKLIASQLKAAGIELKVIECSYSDYIKRLASNNFDLYLGEISVLPNFDLRELTVEGGSAAYGLKAVKEKTEDKDKDKEEKEKSDTDNSNEDQKSKDNEKNIKKPVKEAYESYRKGKIKINDIASVLLTEMPQIPLLYRHGLFFCNENISGVEASECDIYYSFEKYSINN
ncbi:MAG: ABC transporter substrate-binding protein [Clostridia bacterium]|nr:ABC transporter substrate-binding protein [Clostridia bacterium]